MINNLRQFILPEKLRNTIIEFGLSDMAHEVCGLVGGKNVTADTFYPVKNIATDPAREYFMDPGQQIEAMRRMHHAGETLIAIFHSHPDSPAAPSERDLEQAAYPGTVYLILSLANGTPDLNAFYFDGVNFDDELAI